MRTSTPARPDHELPVPPADVPLGRLKVGGLLAEGGEGRVFQLPRTPHLVYKSYRCPTERRHLEELVAWPASAMPDDAARVRAASAWPCSVVSGEGGEAVGLLMPRAPRRFAVRHRDGQSRLASLSYLTADPGHRAVAYGLKLPPPASPERIGLVYALARLLAAFEAGRPSVSHGDLSTKNVLWSLQRGPEVFVIDCDSSGLFGPGAAPVPGRRRAMTPNWDDPAVERGDDPLAETDRYSLALIFLRIVGAANFPIQARQRSGGLVEVDFPVPAGPAAPAAPGLLDPDAAVWDLCRRGLGLADPATRPPAAVWVGALEALLDGAGAAGVMRSVWAAQGGGHPAPLVRPAGPAPADVVIRPLKAPTRAERAWSRVSPVPRYGAGPEPAWRRGAGGFQWRPVAAAAPAAAPTPAQGPGSPEALPLRVWPEIRAGLARAAGWWIEMHATMVRMLLTPGRRRPGTRLMALCGLIDFVLLVALAAVAALVASPFVQG